MQAHPWIILIGLCCAACESDALNLDDPTQYLVQFEPEYLEGDTPGTVELRFDGVDALDDGAGDPTTWTISAVDFGGLYLEGFQFLSNFRVRMSVGVLPPGCTEGCTRTAVGPHEITAQITNNYGTFSVHGTLLVFR